MLEPRYKGHPAAALDFFKGRSAPVPAVEVAHQGDGGRVRRPDDEAVHIQLWDPVAAKAQPGLLGLANVKKIDVGLGDKGIP